MAENQNANKVWRQFIMKDGVPAIPALHGQEMFKVGENSAFMVLDTTCKISRTLKQSFEVPTVHQDETEKAELKKHPKILKIFAKMF